MMEVVYQMSVKQKNDERRKEGKHDKRKNRKKFDKKRNKRLNRKRGLFLMK